MIVADINIIVYLLIRGEKTEQARRVAEKAPQWLVPLLWLDEFTNVLVSYVRFKGLELDKADDTLQQARLLLDDSKQPCDPELALRLAVTYGISGYDALYVALAQQLNTRCVTEDAALRQAVPDWTCSMKEILA